jgi:Tfp pilus assembly protein PilN
MMFARTISDSDLPKEPLVTDQTTRVSFTTGEKIAFASLLVTVFAGMVAIWGELKYLHASTEQRIVALEKRVEASDKFGERLTRVEENTATTKASVQRLEDRLLGPRRADE